MATDRIEILTREYDKGGKLAEYVNKEATRRMITINTVLGEELTYQYYLSILPGGCNEK